MNDVVKQDAVGLLATLDKGRRALAEAKDNFQRLEVRDKAAAIAAAAKILERRDVQVHAAELVARAERAIALTPRETPQESGARGGRGRKGVNADLPLSKQTLSQMRSAHEGFDDEDFEAAVQSAKDEMSPLTRAAVQQAKERKTKERRQAAAERREQSEAAAPYDGMDIRHCSIDELADALELESVDVIITDPPYQRSDIVVYGALGRLAAKVLKPGASMYALSGQILLPQVLAELEAVEGIEYRWVFAQGPLQGARSRVFKASVSQAWKPIIAYRKPPKAQHEEFLSDIISAPKWEGPRTLHKWQQGEAHFDEFMQRFAKPGMTVCDPFLGSGTTAVCARKRGCSFIGCDIDEKSVNETYARLEPRNE